MQHICSKCRVILPILILLHHLPLSGKHSSTSSLHRSFMSSRPRRPDIQANMSGIRYVFQSSRGFNTTQRCFSSFNTPRRHNPSLSCWNHRRHQRQLRRFPSFFVPDRQRLICQGTAGEKSHLNRVSAQTLPTRTDTEVGNMSAGPADRVVEPGHRLNRIFVGKHLYPTRQVDLIQISHQ